MKKEIGQPDFNNLPNCAVEYIKLVIKKMKWRKDARADVQAELIGHFEDALKDCKTNEEKETKAKKLIEDFGDAKLIADLARSAKKRCRPLWIRMSIMMLQISCVVIGLIVLYVLWFMSGKPAIKTNYIEVANKMARPTADDSLNAAEFYDKAAELLEKQNTNASEDKESKCIYKTFAEAAETDITQIRKWLDKNTEALNLITQGAGKPYFWWTFKSTDPNDTSMLSILLPHLGEYRKLAYGLSWRAYLSAQDGQYDKAFADLLTIYKFGKHQKGQKTLVEFLIGISIENLATETVRNILYKNDVPAEYVRTFLKDLQAIVENENFTGVDSFELEKLFIYDEMQRCYVKSIFGIEHLYVKRLLFYINDEMFSSWDSNSRHRTKFENTRRFVYTMFTYQNSKQTRLTLDKFHNFWKDLAVKPPYQFKDRNITDEAEKIVKGNILLRMFSPGIGKIIDLSWRNKAEIENTLAVIALYVYKQEKGYWPENLQELISTGLLISVPMDPYSDKPLVYKRTDNDFTLYSYGSNFKDDGGKLPEKCRIWSLDGQDGDAVFWPVKN